MMEEKPETAPAEKTPKPRKPRGRPKGSRNARRKVAAKPKEEVPAVEQNVVNIEVSREQLLAETILEARGYSEEELDTVLLGLENQEAAYDWVRNMDEFRLPQPLQKLQDEGAQAFRWIDTTDQTCMVQITRENFRWTPVNMLSHGKYFKERERKIRFNKHGGIMSGYMLLCWMPGRLYDKWCEMKGKMSGYEAPLERTNKPPGVDTYDPVRDGTAAHAADTPSTSERFSGVVHVDDSPHPDNTYDEQGEYT